MAGQTDVEDELFEDAGCKGSGEAEIGSPARQEQAAVAIPAGFPTRLVDD